MPVAAFPQTQGGGELLAVDSGQAADITLLRADQSRLSAAALFGSIAPTGRGAGGGTARDVPLRCR